MSIGTSSSSEELTQCRKKRRSRFGCRNCKLRKVKCDETKPQCKRCTSFSLLCNFGPNVPDLQSLADDSIRTSSVSLRRDSSKRPLLLPPVTTAVWASNATAHCHLDARCQDLARRYLASGILPAEARGKPQVNQKLLTFAFSHPYLMHSSLAVAFAYDRYLTGKVDTRRSVEECYHWSNSTALFNKRLREPIDTPDKDPIWATAAGLQVLAASSLDSTRPAEHWPLRSSADDSDLDWLRMGKGKMSLWRTVDPLRPDSIFSVLSLTYAQLSTPLPDKGIDGIPPALAAVCRLDHSSTAQSSPYFGAAHALSQLQEVPDEAVTVGHTELFHRHLGERFRDLLQEKDPVALLLLCLWFRKPGRSIWWIDLRARVECPSICSYLKQHHEGNRGVMAFLPGGALADRWGLPTSSTMMGS